MLYQLIYQYIPINITTNAEATKVKQRKSHMINVTQSDNDFSFEHFKKQRQQNRYAWNVWNHVQKSFSKQQIFTHIPKFQPKPNYY